MKQTIFVLLNSLDIERGGLTKASLKQMDTFVKLGYETHLVTFNFNPKYPYIIQELRKMKRLNNKIIVHNMYNDLSHIDTLKPKFSKPRIANLNRILKNNSYEKRKGHEAYRIFDNGIYTKYISIDSELNHIEFIDYFNQNRNRTSRVMYDLQRTICRKSFMDLHSNRVRQHIYYNKKGRAYFSQWNNPKTNKPIRRIIFNKDGSVKKVFVKDIEGHKTYWLNDLIKEHTKGQAIVISDTRSTDHILLQLNNNKVKKIWRLHSGFRGSPYTPDAKIATAVQTGINNLNQFDAVTLLTDEQKKDMIDEFGDTGNFHVIPHYYNTSVNNRAREKLKTYSNRAVVVSRLSTLKRINDIIRAFKLVNDELPDVHLDIFGKGTEEKKLNNLIKELNLSKKVKLHGYVTNPDEVYSKGLFSILASKQEGFALSILESMANQIPVISYDIKYGPNDMIINNKTGFLVENGNIDMLAEKMVYLFNNPNEARDLGKNAKKHVNSTFSEKVYRKKWKDLFESLKS